MNDKNKVRLQAMVDPDLAEKVKELSDRLDMSQSMFLGILIKHAVEDEEWIIRLVTSRFVAPLRDLIRGRKKKGPKPA